MGNKTNARPVIQGDQMEDSIQKRILLGRSFINKFGNEEGIPEDYLTDQEQKKPQPPLAKAPMRSRSREISERFGSTMTSFV